MSGVILVISANQILMVTARTTGPVDLYIRERSYPALTCMSVDQHAESDISLFLPLRVCKWIG
jgi:hypothetical protein